MKPLVKVGSCSSSLDETLVRHHHRGLRIGKCLVNFIFAPYQKAASLQCTTSMFIAVLVSEQMFGDIARRPTITYVNVLIRSHEMRSHRTIAPDPDPDLAVAVTTREELVPLPIHFVRFLSQPVALRNSCRYVSIHSS